MLKVLMFLFTCSFAAQTMAEDRVLAALLARHGVTGTMVIASLQGAQIFIHNDARAHQPFTPASTFKILNTLIALEDKIVMERGDVFKWNGHPYSIPDWNRDQTLESAFRASCVWCFQELARRIGARNYLDYLEKCAYGHWREPFVDTTFWLDGSLLISAVEQVEFLKRVYRRTLPFSASSYDTLRRIMLVEQTPTFTIRAKTGLGGSSKPQVGWYVGYVETARDVWFFATNLAIENPGELPLRLQLTREALQAKGVFD